MGVGALLGLVHEEHVGVGAVGELEAAVATHRHDRDPGRRDVQGALGAYGPAGDLEGRLQGGVGEPGQADPHVRDVDQAEHVSGADPQQLALADPAYRADRLPGIVLVPARGGQHLLGHRLGGQRDQVVAQHPHALRLALEQVGDVARRGEHVREPLGHLPLVA